MAFVGGLIGGAAKGVADRHLEQRKYAQDQKMQDTRIQAEAKARQEQSQLEEELHTRRIANESVIDMVMKGPGSWPQKRQQIGVILDNSGMKGPNKEAFLKSLDPLGAVHDTAAAQNGGKLPDMPTPSGANVSAAGQAFSSGQGSKVIDPNEMGKHLGYAMGEHILKGGDPKDLNLGPHVPTILGMFAKQEADGNSGTPPSGGASDPASPGQGPQDQGNPPQEASASSTQDQAQAPSVPQASSPESPEEFTKRLNAGPSSAKPEATPSSPLPSRDYFSSPTLDYERASAEIKADAGSARDIAKIKAQNEERLKLEQGRMDMINRQMGGGAGKRPQHTFFTEGPNGPSSHVEAGKLGEYVSGADISEDLEHGGEGADPIDHSPNTLYRRRDFPQSGDPSEYHKANNFKGYGPIREDPPGSGVFVKDALSKTGGILSQIRVPAPSAQQQRSTESTSTNPLGETSIVKRTTGPTPSQPIPQANGGMSEADLKAMGAPNQPPPPPPNGIPYIRGSATPTTPLPERSASTGSQEGRIEPYDYLVNNKLPPRITPLQSRAIRDEANKIAQRNHLSPADVDALRTDKTGAAKGFVAFDSYSQKIDSFEKVLDRNIDLATKLSDAFSRTPNPTLNKLLSAWETGTGSPEAVNLAGQLHAVANEWGKVTTGSTGAQGVPMTERGDVQKFLSAALSPSTLKSFMNTVIRGDVQSRKAGNEAQKAETLNRIRGLAGGSAGGGSSLDDFKKKHGLK